MSDQTNDSYDEMLFEIMALERKYAASERNISTQRKNEIRSIIQKYSSNKVNNDET